MQKQKYGNGVKKFKLVKFIRRNKVFVDQFELLNMQLRDNFKIK